MAHRIEMECVSCALCAEICPEKCIIEEADTFVIDGEACTDCGDCVPVCPIDCIIGQRLASEGAATIEACLAPFGMNSDSDPETEPETDRVTVQDLEPEPQRKLGREPERAEDPSASQS